MKEFLEGVIGVVEANSFESMTLWKYHHQEQGYSWVSNGGGPLVTVGNIGGRPVCISLLCNTIKGHKILFIEATSTLVDWGMIETWLEEKSSGHGVPGKWDLYQQTKCHELL